LVVRYVRALVGDPVIEEFTELIRQRHDSLPVFRVLDRRSLIWMVTHVEVLLVRVVVVEIHVCGSNRSRHANG